MATHVYHNLEGLARDCPFQKLFLAQYAAHGTLPLFSVLVLVVGEVLGGKKVGGRIGGQRERPSIHKAEELLLVF